MAYGFHKVFHTAFYAGGGSAELVQRNVADIAIGGHPYMIDWKADEEALSITTLEIMRDQADQSDSPGEQTVNRQALWRRNIESWHLGAGQEELDRPESSPFRFRSSKGIDIWTRWEFSLLNDTEQVEASVNTNLYAVVAGDHVFMTDGNDIRYWTDLSVASSTLTGIPATDPTSITTDGFHVWTTHGSDGVYVAERGATSTASRITGTISLARYVAGRLMLAEGQSLYDATTEGMNTGAADPLPTALMTHPNSDWEWVDFAESSTHIYAAGFSGDKSQIYATTIQDDATALDAPFVVATLPHGEIVTSLFGYLGQFLGIGTSFGWRLGTINNDGSITLSALVRSSPVYAFEGFAEFIWFGWNDYDSTSTGLGRFSTAQFGQPDSLVPAYASDLMATDQGDVLSIATFDDKRIFTVAGSGLWTQNDDLVSSGTIDSGYLSYGMTETKLGLFVNDFHTGDNDGTVTIYIGTPELAFKQIHTHTGPSEHLTKHPIHIGEISSSKFEVRIELGRDPVDSTAAQTFSSWLFRAEPRVDPTALIIATILLSPDVENRTDSLMDTKFQEELEYLYNLWRDRKLTVCQFSGQSWSVFVDWFSFQGFRILAGQGGHEGMNGSMTLRLKVI